jgi:hypothetical protein
MEKPKSLGEKRRFWELHHRYWNSSGLSQAEYCRENKLSLKTFGYWKRKLKTESTPVRLVEVPALSLKPTFSSSNPIRLMVGSHYRIEIEKEFDGKLLDQLLRFLEQR